MSKKIKCRGRHCSAKLRVRIVRPPLVNSMELKRVVLARAQALVI